MSIHISGPFKPVITAKYREKSIGIQIIDFYKAETPTLNLLKFENGKWIEYKTILDLENIEEQITGLGGVKSWVIKVMIPKINNLLKKEFPPDKPEPYPLKHIEEIDKVLQQHVRFIISPTGTLEVAFKE